MPGESLNSERGLPPPGTDERLGSKGLMQVSEQTALQNPVAEAVQHGLTSSPKSLPAWLFYDEQGSTLFEQITSALSVRLGRW